ncbi:methyltransferase domain-containing protein [Emcibacter sp.]|uniref:methyltransferase domain-containing protein n=1 Tax=Emcibacter sp. TaxID=1979954 RepID=UPI003B6358B4
MNKKVQQRYAEGAKERQADLCCPVDYDPHYLKVIPDEVIEKDYGCGDPSRYIGPGDVVLDLGSGGGKICFIASQVVGPEGRVIGVDMTDDMLELARRNAPVIAEKIGYANVEFRKGQIQDMKTDMSLVEEYLQANPVSDADGYARLQQEIDRLRLENPLVADGSVDIIVSNCVLNLVSDHEKRKLFREMFRVLKPGGRIAISDIVSDKFSPAHLKEDETLWSGCISGAFQEQEFISLLEETGFEAIVIDKYEDDPWQVIEGIEYRSMTVLASKNIESTAGDKKYTVMYKGPWKRVEAENGEVFERGQRQVVREKTYVKISGNPYQDQMITISPGSGSKEKTSRGAAVSPPSRCC